MFISHKDNKIIAISEVEWECRLATKKISLNEYWAWLESVTTENENGTKSYDFSGEDYEIVETDAPLSYVSTDEQGNLITVTFTQSGHIHDGHYHLKWDGNKIIKDDDSLTACRTAEKWKNIRADRNRRLVETDYAALKDNTLSTAMKTYRQALRDVPTQSDPDNITWPTKPE